MTEFKNTYINTTVEVGRLCADRADTVTLVGDDRVRLILIETGQVRMYLDLETASSLADAIQSAVNTASLADAIQSAVNNDAAGERPPLKPLHA